MVTTTFSFHCNACGKCCNSPPAMTVPELFHHERVFIGVLGLRRVPGWRAGQRLSVGGAVQPLDSACARDAEALGERLLFNAGTASSPSRFQLSTQGFDYASRGACPARASDGRCAVQTDRKPATCTTVPLDPLAPDSLQHWVLAGRDSTSFADADCIAPGRRAGHALLVDGGHVVDDAYRARLADQRMALDAERAAWGNAVFALLRPELDTGLAPPRAPTGGYLTLSMAPVLAVLAARSEACRRRCVSYIDAQIDLIEASVAEAMARRLAQDRVTTAELRRHRDAHLALRATMRRHGAAVPAAAAAAGDSAAGPDRGCARSSAHRVLPGPGRAGPGLAHRSACGAGASGPTLA